MEVLLAHIGWRVIVMMRGFSSPVWGRVVAFLSI